MINYPDSIRVYDDFLSEENAYKIYATLSSLPQQWFSLHRSYIDESNNPQKAKTWWNIHGDKSRAPDYDPQGRMTYQYLATNEHQEGCNCVYCDMTTLFDQNPPPEAQGLHIMDSQLSLFRPGDYMSQHTDEFNNRIWAFSYSLSVGWRPEWGGVLHAQDPDDGEWYAFPPVFNRLIMMDVTPGSSVNHYVSEVVPSCPVNRVTFSGWWGMQPDPTMQEPVVEAEVVQEDGSSVWEMTGGTNMDDGTTESEFTAARYREPIENYQDPAGDFDPEFEFKGDFDITFNDDDQLDEAS